MGRRGGWRAAAVTGGILVVTGLVGCGGPASGDELRSAADDLASVGSPDGKGTTGIDVVGCDDDAEMPAAYADFDHDVPEPKPYDRASTDAFNAELDAVSDWYAPRWEKLGWKVDDEHGSAFKEVGGRTLRAAIDAGGGGYTIVVVDNGAGLCN